MFLFKRNVMNQDKSALRCPYCGAYYRGTVPQGANYVTCQYCGTSIQVIDFQSQDKLILAERVIQLTEKIIGKVIQEEREERLFDKNRIPKEMITEARNFANYSYLAFLICGALIALYGVYEIFWALLWLGSWVSYFARTWFVGTLFYGIILIALGGLGVLIALNVWKPKLVDAIDQGKYSEAYQTASSHAHLIIAFICGGLIPTGLIPAILLYLTKNKLAKMSETLPPPPPP